MTWDSSGKEKKMTEKSYDVIIIGAGPNGLATGAYLSKAGLRVLLLERRHEVGGGLLTEEVTLPGFLHNTHAVYMLFSICSRPVPSTCRETHRASFTVCSLWVKERRRFKMVRSEV